MLKIKSGVKPRNLYIAAAVANVAEILGITVTVTAGSDGKHQEGSLHYEYAALDIRSKDMPDSQRDMFLNMVLARLGDSYQGFLESKGKPNEHFHIEYDPK